MKLRSYFYRSIASVGIINKDHYLQHVARCGHTSAIKALVEAGADRPKIKPC
jgi:hypothetical protein